MTEEGRRLLEAATLRPWWGDPPHGWGVFQDAPTHEQRRWLFDRKDGTAGDAALIVAAVNQYEALLDLWEAAIDTVERIDAAADQGYDVSPDPALADLLRDPLALLATLR